MYGAFPRSVTDIRNRDDDGRVLQVMQLDLPTQTDPASWGRTLTQSPVLDRSIGGLVPVSVRRWRDIPSDIEQAALSDHFVSIHLGGSKRLQRWGEGRHAVEDTLTGAHSVVPAGSAFRWHTTGPVDFVHFYFHPKVVDFVIEAAFDRDRTFVALEPGLGDGDGLIRMLALNLLDELNTDDPQQAYFDDMMHLFLCRILRLHSNARDGSPVARHVLAPYRLRRALDFIETNLATKIGVEEIAQASGVSQFHFSRAFRRSTGRTPYAYLLDRRVQLAKSLLRQTDAALTQVAASCGFSSLAQFSRMFKRCVGLCPRDFRARR